MRRLQRAVGLVIVGMAVLGAAALSWALSTADGQIASVANHEVVIGVWRLMYDTEAPSLPLVVAAVGIALVCAAGVAETERRIATRARRSEDQARMPLAPRIVMEETRGVFAGEITVTVVIPAHNEQDRLPATLASLRDQSRRPDRVIVVADNCTDATVAAARAAGVEVTETVANSEKKAGALNQLLAVLLPDQGDNDLVMVMDADTMLDRGFIDHAVRRMSDDRALMAVGGLFYGEEGGGLLGQFQRNEFVRYSRDVRRRRGRLFVLTGTASVFRPRALRTVAAERGRMLPGRPGQVYDTLALTEDNELTLALKSLGALMISPGSCTVVTEVMPTWRSLWAQRLRWQRGALENLGAYGVRPQTFRYWMQQLGIGYGVIALASYLLMMLVMALALDTWVWFPFWIGVGLVFVVERVATVWAGGWWARLIALLIIPELTYALFLDAVYIKGVADISLGHEARWQHVVTRAEAAGSGS
ncbi:glycosyltransferase family 2 protein [Nocardioides sp. DS6]|uniref:Glycosyltransferase family 2 protein n=1 Tax=Nocardioides eburneus TaxID=3231482 RepID=A0ABV3SVG0_9ACTN